MAGQLEDKQAAERRRRRSVVLALVLGAFALVFYVLTIAKLGPNVLNRPL